mmetsp:Transcript_18149/g.36821  ORF Transcript_18149/g.36821 Transcript_18149/m.36821 type:complete len:237 (-) Transcript_18149:35-745(-)
MEVAWLSVVVSGRFWASSSCLSSSLFWSFNCTRSLIFVLYFSFCCCRMFTCAVAPLLRSASSWTFLSSSLCCCSCVTSLCFSVSISFSRSPMWASSLCLAWSEDLFCIDSLDVIGGPLSSSNLSVMSFKSLFNCVFSVNSPSFSAISLSTSAFNVVTRDLPSPAERWLFERGDSDSMEGAEMSMREVPSGRLRVLTKLWSASEPLPPAASIRSCTIRLISSCTAGDSCITLPMKVC